jgi:hypothetical protein
MVAKSCSPTQNTSKHNTQHTQQPNEPLPPYLLPAALPSLSMATSAMDPNQGAAAPHESYAGFRCGGLVHTALFPFYGAPKWHLSKKREKDRTLTLGSHHLMGEYNNQPKVGIGKGLEGGKRCAGQ